MGSGTHGARLVWSGKVRVDCVHAVEKRQITTEEQLTILGLERAGVLYDPKQHKIHRCTCCENLFVDPSDEPMYCHECRRPLIHVPTGPLQLPGGVVDG